MALSVQQKRILRRILVATFCVLVVGLIASWFVAGELVSARPREMGGAPSELNATSFTIASKSGATISGWHTQAEPSHGVIVLLHGIRGSRLTMLERARWLHGAGYSTVMIDLRAHGESSGEQITVGHLEKHDVHAAVEYARQQHPHEPVGVIGISLGGAAALLASPLDIDALVLESVYPNINDAIHNRVAAQIGPLALIPSTLLLIQLELRLGISPSELRPIDHLPNVGCPIYILSGNADQHTTPSETKEMFSIAPEPKELWLVDDAAHVDLFHANPTQYQQRIGDFIDLYLKTKQASKQKKQ